MKLIQSAYIRRERVLDAIGETGIAIVHASPEQWRNGDCYFPYRPDSDFYYLTAFEEPEAILVLDGATRSSIFFCREKNPEQEIWTGFRYGIHLAREYFGFNQTFPIGEFSSKIEGLLKKHQHLYLMHSRFTDSDYSVQKIWHSLKGTQSIQSLRNIVHSMRMIKDEEELQLLKRAASISAAGHRHAMQITRPNLNERIIEGEIAAEFARHGARYTAYPSIIAGGKNACTLHYVANNASLRDGDLLMIDAGAEYSYYAGDISRTFPINGKFSAAQRDVYNAILNVNNAAITACTLGTSTQSINELAIKMLTESLIDLKLLQGTAEENIAQKNYRRFYMHSIGHRLGLDVHDVGGHDDQCNILHENMCMTIEPGLYIPDADDIPHALRGIGIRIEDNIIIRPHGAEVYTHEAPKTIDEIEDLMHG